MKFILILLFPTLVFSQINFNYTDEKVLNEEKLKVFESFAYSKEYKHDTNSVLIIKDGNLIYEKYKNGFNQDSALQTWSVSKSITSAMVGIAIDEGFLKLDDPVSKYYPNIKSKNLNIEHLLSMTSGLNWNEGYEGNPLASNVIKMLYTKGFDDMAAYVSNLDQKYLPGERFQYSSGVTNLLSGILNKALGEEYKAFPWTKIFDPLGISSATFQTDQNGIYVASSYLFMNARDQAKFAQLYLNKGLWMGRKIISSEYVNLSTQASKYFDNPKEEDIHKNFAYGFQWWVNKSFEVNNKKVKAIDSLPDDSYMALGHWGQHIVIIPSKKLIIIRAAADKKGGLDRNKFFKLLLESIN